MTELKPIHFSSLKQIGKSPLHYKARHDKTEEHTPEQERQMRIGTLAHKLILEPDRTDVAVFQGKVRNGKVWEAFEAEHAGQLIVTVKEMERGQHIAARVHADPLASKRLIGIKEGELPTWTWLGRTCGGRPDVLGDRFTTEVKTSPDTSPGWMARHCLRMVYHGQLRWYNIGAETLFKRPYDEAYIVAVEVKEPFAVTTFRLTPRALEAGERICRSWMERLLACEAADEWPGYAQHEIDLDVIEDEALIYEEENA